MKFSSTVLTLAVAGSVSASRHAHGHHHAHLDKRVVTQVVPVPGPTVVAYVLDGKNIPKEQACAGVKSGKYSWGDGNDHSEACGAGAPAPPSAPAPPAGNQFYEAPSSAPPAPPAAPTPSPGKSYGESAPEPEAPKPSYTPEKPDDSGEGSEEPSGGEGVDREFPDGEIDCGDFPS
ncbi:hypothetical protein FQN49_007388, partial [Arthroderma sp. PD_2]